MTITKVNKILTVFSNTYMDTLRDLEAVEFTTINEAYNEVLNNLDLNSLDMEDTRLRFWDYSTVIGMLIETIQFYLIKLGIDTTQMMLNILGRKFNPIDPNELLSLTGMEGNQERSIHLELDERIQSHLDDVEKLVLVNKIQDIDTKPIIKEILNMILSDTLRISRSEGMRCFRESQRRQLEA
jgi:hypothetical protein